MRMLSSIPSLVIYALSIHAINPELRDVGEFYQNNYLQIELFYTAIRNKRLSGKICEEFKLGEILFTLQGYTGVKDSVFFPKGNSKFGFTIDGSNYFDTPAFIMCVPHKNGAPSNNDKYVVLITDIRDVITAGFHRFYLDDITDDGHWRIVHETVRYNQLFKKNYNDYIEIMTVWYTESEKKLNITEFCMLELEPQKPGSPTIAVQGRVKMGNFFLILNEDIQGIYLPGIIACEIRQPGKRKFTNYMIYNPDDLDILDDFKKINKFYTEIHNANRVINGRCIYVLHDYLLNVLNETPADKLQLAKLVL